MTVFLLRNIRKMLYIFFILLAVAIYIFWGILYSGATLQAIRITQTYALTALTLLYVTLLISPLYAALPALPFRAVAVRARRALGVSTFFFSALHAGIAFFGQLGGFPGLAFLSDRYLLAISLSFTALLILSVMAATSFDYFMTRLGSRWKMLHRLVYAAAMLILIHAVMLGTHFEKLYEFIPQLTFTAVAILLFLEIIRLDIVIKRKFPNLTQSSIVSLPLYILLAIGIFYFLLPLPEESGLSFGIHAQHIQLAKEAQGGSGTGSAPAAPSNIPGLRGDRTKRFTLDYTLPDAVQANTDTPLSFRVYDASSGNQVTLFSTIYSKVVHLIIVDSTLTYFNHIHPEYKNGEFSITTVFPRDGQYHLYADFQPIGAIEQRIGMTVNVGAVQSIDVSRRQPDTRLTKTFGDYEVTLNYPRPLRSEQISIGQQLLGFTVKDTATKQPVTTLKPYLEAFGHMVLIDQKTFDYIHVHPNDLRVPRPDENGGPTVEFMPLGLSGPIKPGVYRIFAQFNPNNELFTADFTIQIE